MTERILVPVDLRHTDRLTKALDLAVSLAKAEDAELIYCGVADAHPTVGKETVGEKMAKALATFAAEQ